MLLKSVILTSLLVYGFNATAQSFAINVSMKASRSVVLESSNGNQILVKDGYTIPVFIRDSNEGIDVQVGTENFKVDLKKPQNITFSIDGQVYFEINPAQINKVVGGHLGFRYWPSRMMYSKPVDANLPLSRNGSNYDLVHNDQIVQNIDLKFSWVLGKYFGISSVTIH